MLAIYPGTFDPLTLGHLDILQRSLGIFDQVEVGVAASTSKKTLFTLEERCDLVRAATSDWPGVTVAPFDGLLVDYVRQRGASIVIRGIRQVTDFDYEQRMAFINRRLYPALETLFLMPTEAHALISASLVREVHRWQGDTSSFVPPAVEVALRKKNTNS